MNDNNKVIIDDNYENLTFVHRVGGIKIEPKHEVPNWSTSSSGSGGKYKYNTEYFYPEDVGMIPEKLPTLAGIRYLNSKTKPSYCLISIYSATDENGRRCFYYSINTMELGAEYEVVSFAYLRDRLPSNSGLIIHNSEGKLVFNAELGYMQVLDHQQHWKDVHNTSTSYYTVDNPWSDSIDFGDMYIIPLQTPFITIGGTIVINYRRYVPAFYQESDGKTIKVSLGYWGSGGGGARVQNYQNYFSFSMVYVPF